LASQIDFSIKGASAVPVLVPATSSEHGALMAPDINCRWQTGNFRAESGIVPGCRRIRTLSA